MSLALDLLSFLTSTQPTNVFINVQNKETSMKIIYDREVDALSIIFQETTVITQHLSEGIAVDYDAKGKLASIEILDATKLPMLCINKLKHW